MNNFLYVLVLLYVRLASIWDSFGGLVGSGGVIMSSSISEMDFLLCSVSKLRACKRNLVTYMS